MNGNVMNHQESRIIELEARVRLLSNVVACIPMAAAGLRLIPLGQYAAAMESPVEAMKVLESIAEQAEIGQELIENFGAGHELIHSLVASRRRRIEREIAQLLL